MLQRFGLWLAQIKDRYWTHGEWWQQCLFIVLGFLGIMLFAEVGVYLLAVAIICPIFMMFLIAIFGNND